MGDVLKSIGGLFGGAPKASKRSIEETEEQREQAKKARVSLYGTEGGVLGAPLEGGSVGGRTTLLGN